MMLKDIQLSAILQYVKDTDTLETARQELLQDGVSAQIVINKQSDIVGIITERDMLKVNHDEYKHVTVGDICSSQLLLIPDNASIDEASIMMLNHHCHHLIVTSDENLTVKGILSSLDVVRAHLK